MQTQIKGSAIGFLGKLKANTAGGTMIMTALLMPVIAGFAGTGIDVSEWLTQKRALQSATDEAAIAGAYLALANQTSSAISDAADSQGTKNGLQLGAGDTITVNSPPVTGGYVGKAGYVEVNTTRKAKLYFASLLHINSIKIASRAVAGGVDSGQECILALDPTVDRAVEFSGTANVNAACGVASDSSSSQSIYVGGNATLSADPAQAYGDVYVSNNGTLITNSPVQSFSQRLADPYSNLQVPPEDSTCTMTKASIGNNVTLSPGRYCGGLTLKGSNITLSPGTYIVDGGNFTTNGGASFSGTGVTIILTGSSPSKIGTIQMNGGTTATLTAPSTGTYAGVLFFQDRSAPVSTTTSNSFQGGANLNLNGILYFPNQNIDFTGGAKAAPACLQIVGRKVTFTGNSYVQNDPSTCSAINVKPIARIAVRLVE